MHAMRKVPMFVDAMTGNHWQQNGEQLNNCLKSLLGLYSAFNAG